MKKFMKLLSKSLCLLLVLVISVAAVGCGKDEENSGGTTGGGASNRPTHGSYNPDYINTENYVDDPVAYGLDDFGTHVYLAPETEDRWLISGGTTEYTLVVPKTTTESGSGFLADAIDEFVYFFKMATGISIKTMFDVDLAVNNQTHNASQHYISIDETTLFKSSGLSNSVNELGLYGAKITLVDNNIYICGYTDRGSLNGVYTFLDLTFNLEVYSANTIEIDKDVKDLKLRNYQVVDIPDVGYQNTSTYEMGNWGESPDYAKLHQHATYDGRMYGTRMRAAAGAGLSASSILPDPEYMTANGYSGYEGYSYVPGSTDPEQIAKNEEYIKAFVPNIHEDPDALNEATRKQTLLVKPGGHNSVQCVPKAEWEGVHPEWYGGVQLCYTAGGDEESLNEITSRFADMIKTRLMIYPVAEYPYNFSIDITTWDDPGMCTCKECAAEKLIYKDSGLVMKYWNITAQKVKEWMELPENAAYRRDNFEIRYYAYLATEDPPAKLNTETGEWEPIDETVVMHKNTCVKYANINTDFQQSLFAEDNAWAKDMFDGWVACAKENSAGIGYFMYNYNLKHNYFYDGFDHYDTKGLNYYLSGGRSYYYSENIHGASPTEFGALISFINAKLCYNSLLDSGKLIQSWFDACFGPASGIMMKLFNDVRMFCHNEAVEEGLYNRFSIYNQTYAAYNWQPAVCEGWIATCDEAHEVIAYLKDADPDEWDRIAYNIELEAFSPIGVHITQNSKTMSDARKLELKNRVLDNVSRWEDFQYVDFLGQRVRKWIDTI